MKRHVVASILWLAAGACVAGPALARDTTPPVITENLTGTLGANGWYTSNVGLSWTVTDPESSRIRKTGCGSVSLTTDTAGTTYTCSATSGGGTSTKSVTIKRDATLPTATITTPAGGATYNAGQSVTANYSCSDLTSGIGACVGPVTNGAAIDTTTGGSKTFTVTATDNAGNKKSVPVNYTVVAVDTTPPVITPTVSGTLGNNGWYTSSVNVTWAVTDAESAVSAQNGCGAASVTSDTAGTTFTCTATSAGGTSSKSVTIKRDATRPTATIASPAAGATYTLNQSVTASYACADPMSGIANCSGTTPNGLGINTSSTGTKNFTVNATDSAGNTTSASVTYSVSSSTSSSTTGTRLFAWNDLGMHCMDTDYSVFTLLPPFNSLTAQLMVNGKLVNDDTISKNYTLEYVALTDGAGSTNSSHQTTGGVDKTNFWTNFQAMFGAPSALKAGIGLFGFSTPTKSPETMEWNGTDAVGHSGFKWYEAYGIPVTPTDDAGHFNPYPMVKVTARDNATGKVVASSSSVLPVSTEMNCAQCHKSVDGSPDAIPADGVISNPALSAEQEWRYNALRKHDDRFKNNATFLTLMGSKGFKGTTLEYSAANGKPIFCDACHNSNALAYWGFGGDASVSQMTTAMHKAHSTAKLPGSTKTLNDDPTREACYSCHPGKSTQCLRGAMGNPTDPLTKQHTMECQSCHGSMTVVGTGKMGDLVNGTITNLRERRPWFDMPTCQTCHQNGQRYTSALTVGAGNNFAYRASNDTRFATKPNTPNLLPGLSMYRFSTGHGNLQCAACHNSTHAEFTTKTAPNSANDDQRAIEAQGYSAAIRECTACHSTTPSTTNGGPHGMHSIGASWVKDHHDVVSSSNTGDCLYCHGTTSAGSDLAVIKVAKTFNIGDGRTKSFAAEQRVTCWSCHDGPSR
jgi:hypothetical protein